MMKKLILIYGWLFWGLLPYWLQAVPLQSELIFIPEGEVHLGSTSEEKAFGYRIGSRAAKKWKWFDKEQERTVFIKSFYIDKYLVTQSQYAEFVKETGHRVPHITQADYQKQGFLVHPYKSVIPYLWEKGAPKSELLNHPVVLVSVDDAQAFCAWRGKQNNRAMRLPTEDEWEKAARGIDHRNFPWGNQWNPDNLNTVTKGPYRTTPVDQYPQGKSVYGGLDMAGNLFQWTQTPDASRPQRYILKGCSWDDAPGICRSAARHSRLKTSRHILIGFRCVSDSETP